MTVKDILIKHLFEHNFNGLYCPENYCSCDIDHLFECEDDPSECKPGYKLPIADGCHKSKYQRIVPNPKNYKIQEPKYERY